MIIGVVIALVVLLAFAVVMGVARDPGPDPADVAIGYARAFGTGDFDAMYRLIDPDLLKGRNRQEWVARSRTRPHVAFAPDGVVAQDSVVRDETATIRLAIGPDRLVPVELVRRHRMWTVASFDGVETATGRQ